MSSAGDHLEPSPLDALLRHSISPCAAGNEVYPRLEGIHQDYRASILRRFTISIPRFYSMRLNFTAEPLVVHGKLILMTIFAFYEDVGSISFSTLSQAHFQFCPHLGAGRLFHPDIPLLAAIRFTFNEADGQRGLHQKVHSCDRCPTDYSIAIKDRRATLYIWQDPEAGTSPTDPYWRCHILDEVNQFNGTKFGYEHGSVRGLYYSNGT